MQLIAFWSETTHHRCSALPLPLPPLASSTRPRQQAAPTSTPILRLRHPLLYLHIRSLPSSHRPFSHYSSPFLGFLFCVSASPDQHFNLRLEITPSHPHRAEQKKNISPPSCRHREKISPGATTLKQRTAPCPLSLIPMLFEELDR